MGLPTYRTLCYKRGPVSANTETDFTMNRIGHNADEGYGYTNFNTWLTHHRIPRDSGSPFLGEHERGGFTLTLAEVADNADLSHPTSNHPVRLLKTWSAVSQASWELFFPEEMRFIILTEYFAKPADWTTPPTLYDRRWEGYEFRIPCADGTTWRFSCDRDLGADQMVFLDFWSGRGAAHLVQPEPEDGTTTEGGE